MQKIIIIHLFFINFQNTFCQKSTCNNYNIREVIINQNDEIMLLKGSQNNGTYSFIKINGESIGSGYKNKKIVFKIIPTENNCDIVFYYPISNNSHCDYDISSNSFIKLPLQIDIINALKFREISIIKSKKHPD